MKNSRILWLIIAILIIFFLVILRSPKTVNIAQKSSKRTDTIKNQSDTDDQASLATSLENITHPKICVGQWREELITNEEVLQCIDRYKQELESLNCKPKNGGEDQCPKPE